VTQPKVHPVDEHLLNPASEQVPSLPCQHNQEGIPMVTTSAACVGHVNGIYGSGKPSWVIGIINGLKGLIRPDVVISGDPAG
jgi:hypothetical protein